MHYIVFKVLRRPFCGTASLVYRSSSVLSTPFFQLFELFFNPFFQGPVLVLAANVAYITPFFSRCQYLIFVYFSIGSAVYDAG
ncbi:MAG: hypothetical protein IKP38_07685, partial [Clostridia bacterium]|nr:hypothetical protein [Clostridia bacterium]